LVHAHFLVGRRLAVSLNKEIDTFTMEKPQILLTNDDGILSPGLWKAAEALSEIGFVHVVAPRDQCTSAGRSMPTSSDGIIIPQEVQINGKKWTVFAVGASPAQAVIHAVLEILPAPPDIVVSGINYGENMGTGVTISGTVGAAIEAAAMDIKSIAVSLETEKELHLSYSQDVDFTAAAHFTAFFTEWVLNNPLPADVDLLKIEVPSSATRETPWRMTRLSRKRYYLSLPPKRTSWDVPGTPDYQRVTDLKSFDPQSDVYVMSVHREVAVTPLSIDLTSRINLPDLADQIKKETG
jgi:5'-nucleotidase